MFPWRILKRAAAATQLSPRIRTESGLKVCGLGCGVLRGGYWLTHFLNAGCYCGIEPHAGRLTMGLQTTSGARTYEAKRPRFETNANFDPSAFGERLTLSRVLDLDARVKTTDRDDARRLPAVFDGTRRVSHDVPRQQPGSSQDYRGDTWYGTSHESVVTGCIRHRRSWIKTRAEPQGFGGLRVAARPLPRSVLVEIRRRAGRRLPGGSRYPFGCDAWWDH